MTDYREGDDIAGIQPGDTVTLEGAKAAQLIRESGLDATGVERVVLTRSEQEGRWHLNAKYQSNDALMEAHGLGMECSGLVAATHSAPDCFHRKTSLVGLVLTARLVASGRIVRPGAEIVESRTSQFAEAGDDGELRLTIQATED